MSAYKLSLWSAILVNINIMFGTGLFINTIMLAKRTGFFGFVSYMIVATLLIPLIVGFGLLLKHHPSGGFYVYGAQEISPFVGFVSAWAYFIGKLASAALLIHVFSTLISAVIPPLAAINPFVIDLFIIGLFTWLNVYNFRTGKVVMYTFLVLKLTPILFVIFACLYLINQWSIPADTLLWEGIPSTIPLVLYAFTGFEACCSLSSALQDPAKDGPRAISISYTMVVCLTIVYQLLFFLAMGPVLMQQQNSLLGVFPPLLSTLWSNYPMLIQKMAGLLHIAIATASLGGSYGILFSNHWNLYALAQHNHLLFKQAFTKLNYYHIPVLGIVLEAVLCAFYLLVLRGNIVLLQQMSVFACTITFCLSMVALLQLLRRNQDKSWRLLMALLAIMSCVLLLALCIKGFVVHGTASLYLFLIIFLIGLGIFFWQKQKYSLH
jgi:amino acid transporter